MATSQLEAQESRCSRSTWSFQTGRVLKGGRANNSGHPSHVYRTQDDRYLTIVPIVGPEWNQLWECLEATEKEIAANPSLQSDAGRNAQFGERSRRRWRAASRREPLASWLDALTAAKVPRAGAVREEFIDHPAGLGGQQCTRRSTAPWSAARGV